ncbi:MAG: hypothetical protein ACR5LA_06875 [Wolbachia sp.]
MAARQQPLETKNLLDTLRQPPYHDNQYNDTKNNIIEFNRIIPRELLIRKRPNRVNAV